MKDAELSVVLAEMRQRAFSVLLSIAKDKSLDDRTVRQSIIDEGKRIERFLSDNLEDE